MKKSGVRRGVLVYKQLNLGIRYDIGLGVPQDAAEAVRWYRLAAEQGYADAQGNLGLMYANGEGVPQDAAEAVRWYRLAADQGHANAQITLGAMYAFGEGVPQDDAEAVRWYRLAANQGDASAQYNLGIMNDTGRGVPQDDAEAVRWYRLAADQGDAEAQYNLGIMYANGEGVPEDDAEAVRWYRLAAEQGDASAQYNLGVMYAFGNGVPQDSVYAYAWVNLAVAALSGDERDRRRRLEYRETLEKRLSRAELSDAQRLSREWAAGNFSPNTDASGGGTDPVPTAPLVQGSGTAFIVHPDGRLLTAHHVIDGATSISVSCNGEPAVPATVTSSSVATDLAILEASGELGTDSFLRLSPQRVPSLGDTVFTIGYPTPDLLGTDPKYTNGTVSALSGLRGDASFLQISVPIQPGNSGGPLVNEDGDVIGVVVATASAPAFIRATDSIPQNINWAVKSAFASVLFEPPPADRTPTTDADTTVIERVTAATCLVRVTAPAQ